MLSPLCIRTFPQDRMGEYSPSLETVAESSALYLLFRVLRHRTQLPDMPLRSGTQALRFITSITLILRREKCHSREEKSAFP